MEAALLSGVLKIAGGKLAPLLLDEFTSITGVKKDLSELQHLFGGITSLLSAVGDRATGSDPSSYWLKDLKDVVYDFDDLLNKVHLEAEKQQAGIDADKHGMANWFRAKPKSGLSRLEMAREIKKIKKRFAKIVKQRTEVNAITTAIATNPVVEHPVQLTNKTIGDKSILADYIDEKKVLCRDEVKHDIVCKLLEADSQERISIVSIVGLGGSGKTTLARYICQDSKIKDHFEVVFRVHVSEEFIVEKLIAKLFESVSDQKSELYTSQYMSRAISEKLKKGKFLLVFDDVWNKDKYKWEQFEQNFSSGATGSKILLTTRDVEVAEAVKSKEVINLPLLSDDDGWKLFQQRYGLAEKDMDAEFIEVGKEIMKKCAGVPLAITSLAGVLSNKREITKWRTLRDSNLLDEPDIKGKVSGSLKLSYLQLSDDLKQCFVLCTILLKGSRMYKDHLTSQWRAHGFVNPVNGSWQPEDIASDFFDSLLKVSFLQDLVEEEDTGRLICKMHDLVHDLSRQILQDELVLTPQKITAHHDQRCRYLSLASCTEKIDRKLFNKVRALYVNWGSFATDKPIKKGGCVRSVILEGLKDASFPMSALKFEYLGYLRFSFVGCTKLPSAISSCWNLQALHIIRCPEFKMLPESIGKLKRLRTLELSETPCLRRLPQSIGDCQSLESLCLLWCWDFIEIPDSIAKNEKLRILDIVKCHSFRILPSTCFKMLQSINLTGCLSLKKLPSSLGSNELHTLKLYSLSELTILPQCITSLSSLKHLDLGYCRELTELPKGIVNLQQLKVLNLDGCHKLRGLPAGFGQLTHLRKLGLFVIGDNSEHARISEFGNFDMLSGVLEIKGIRYVKDPGDVEKAYLKKKKKNIQKLKLRWSSIETDVEEEVDMEQELAVLNGLEPPSGITKLDILGYQGLHSPCWMTKERHSSHSDSQFKQTVDLPDFPHLIKMVLNSFPRLKHLSGLVGFPSLKTLVLGGFGALESINAGPFPSVTELGIFEMPHLLEFSTTIRIALADEDGVIECGNQEPQCCFPRLSTLCIENCPKLTVRPWFLPSLESLTLHGSFRPVHPHRDESESPPSCSSSDGASSSLSLLKKLELTEMTGPSGCSGWELLRHLTSLQELEISQCSRLPELPEWLGEIRSLQSLAISFCENLRVFPEGFQHLTSLHALSIYSCRALHQLPEGLGALRSLRSFRIWNLPKLSCLPESMRGLTSLQNLHINSCDSLHRLPEWLGELRSLQQLEIKGLHAVTCLPESMQRLTSLHHLCIEHCDALTALPEWIGHLSALQFLKIQGCLRLTSLPSSIQRLASLQTLQIWNSPGLARRYKRGEGEDWHLISRIPNVDIM